MSINYIIGIDEVGRGPLAGPVTICAAACLAPSKSNTRIQSKDLKHLLFLAKDSKKTKASERELVSRLAKEIRGKKDGQFFFELSSVSAQVIDQKGISFAINKAIKNVLLKLEKQGVNSENGFVYLDGSLKADSEYQQETVIKGDAKIKVIGLASIIAKNYRDGLMNSLAKKYPGYDLEIHKGYGTAKHISLIKKNKLSPLHRKTFCKNIAC